MISQDRSDRHFSHLVYRYVMLRGRTLFFFGRGQRSFEVTRGQNPKPSLTQYLKVGMTDTLHIWDIDCHVERKNPFDFGGGFRSYEVTGRKCVKTSNGL